MRTTGRGDDHLGLVALCQGLFVFLWSTLWHWSNPCSAVLLVPYGNRAFDAKGPKYEKQRYDGWYNNMAHPEWGSAGSTLSRKMPPAYEDGVYMMAGSDRPSPRKLSQVLMKGSDGLGSLRNRTAMVVFFGQVVAAEILMASHSGCPIEIAKIPIDRCDEMFDPECTGEKNMPFVRASYDKSTGQSPNVPRSQVNRMSSWIDGSFVYSTNEAWASTMRNYSGGAGTLKWMEGVVGMPPTNKDRVPLWNPPAPHLLHSQSPERMFVLGDPRTNQNVAFLTMGILFYRWHNVLAGRIKSRHPKWSDEDVFQAARRWNIATLQNIVAYEFLPAFIGANLKPYQGYKPGLYPGITHDFQSAAFRFGHTLVPPGIYRRDGKCNFDKYPVDGTVAKAIRLCSHWWDAEKVMMSSIRPRDGDAMVADILRGIASQIAEREDTVLCSDVRNKLWGPMEFSRRDLASINIMRGRDSGLADYNTVRLHYGLPPVANWSQINEDKFAEDPDLLDRLKGLYGEDGLHNIDLYVGGLLESKDGPGPLFTKIIKEQFETLRDADRFWFENELNGFFTKAEMEAIRKVKLWDVIVNSTSVKPEELQRNVFVWTTSDPCPQPGQLTSEDLPECQFLRGFDAFRGNETIYILALVLLILIPLASAATAYCLVKLHRRRLDEARRNQESAGCCGCFRLAKVAAIRGRWGSSAGVVGQGWRRGSGANQDGGVGSSVALPPVWEWQGPDTSRRVLVGFDRPTATLVLKDSGDRTLRSVSLAAADPVLHVKFNTDTKYNRPLLWVELKDSHDLVLEFESSRDRDAFLEKLQNFYVLTDSSSNDNNNNNSTDNKGGQGVDQGPEGDHHLVQRSMILSAVMSSDIMASAETKEERQRKLDRFFREAYSLTFGSPPAKGLEKRGDLKAAMQTALTRQEFAEALGMRQGDLFVRKMFRVVDKDGDGKISFQEFLDMVTRFSSGGHDLDEKLRILFDMCDANEDGHVAKQELAEMIGSVIELGRAKRVSTSEARLTIGHMFSCAGIAHKNVLSYEDFKLVLSASSHHILTVGLEFKGAKKNFVADTSEHPGRFAGFVIEPPPDAVDFSSRFPFVNAAVRQWKVLTTFLEDNRQNIFYLVVFYLLNVLLFVDKFTQYAFLSEHTGLRRVMGMGIAITRGAAASLSFCYSLLLLTMSRNFLTKLKESPLYQYIPIDAHVQFHKICACTALFFSVVHSVSHLINFYHVATQPADHLLCMSPEVFVASDFRADIPYWLFKTLTGLTGVLLYIICAIMAVFSFRTVREKAYSYFWATHQLYVVVYAMSLLHGLQRLTSQPMFWAFLVGPLVIFVVDKIISLRRGYVELDVLETEILPSEVIKVTFYRPPNFTYLSGQWARMCCPAIGSSEFHSLSLTSAPHESSLSMHIKARGPWTWRLRNFFDPGCIAKGQPCPTAIDNGRRRTSDGNGDDIEAKRARLKARRVKILLQGPFGGGNQDWYKFEVAVMIGAGIGVTPYASILNDLVFGTSTNRFTGVACKKVYFLWICPTHRNYEWFIDVLKDVEEKDVTKVLDVHIFITQFFHKYDLRTTMLYICENHFQRMAGKSLFTGLKAANHFGRPDLVSFMSYVQRKHSYVSRIGVFSCGPRAVIRSSEAACEAVNLDKKYPRVTHHFEQYG